VPLSYRVYDRACERQGKTETLKDLDEFSAAADEASSAQFRRFFGATPMAKKRLHTVVHK
jgi:hypothetical protein